MKKQITLDEIKSIDHDELAKLVYTQMDSHPTPYEKIEKLLLADDPMAVIKSIKKDIGSIKRGRKFISYYESFEFAKRVESIVDDIATMVTNPLQARLLYKELILTDSKVYLRSDDSSGSIQTAYAAAMDGWKGCLSALSDEEIYADINQMLVCDGFGIRDLFSEEIPADVLKKIYDERHEKLKGKSIGEFEYSDDLHAMLQCAHYLKEPQRYIEASELRREVWNENDIVDFAQEYQYADDAEGVLQMLGHIVQVGSYRRDDFFALQIWAYEKLGRDTDVTLAYKNWYAHSKSPEILKKYLDRLDDAMRERVKQEALQDANEMTFSSALHFFHTLDEASMAAEYILANRNRLETQYIYNKELKKIIEWLENDHPQEVILLYRDSCEKSLQSSQSKYYPSAIRALKACIKIEEKYTIEHWHIEDNMDYMERLINEHSRKPKFVSLFFEAFGEL